MEAEMRKREILKAELIACECWDVDFFRHLDREPVEYDAFQHRQKHRMEVLMGLLALSQKERLQ